MEYYLGAHQAKAVFMPALENKMSQVNSTCNNIEVDNEDSFVKVCFPSLDGSEGDSVCSAVFDVIEQVGQPRCLASYLNRHYEYLSEEIRCNVLISTLKELWFCEDIFLRDQIIEKIRDYLKNESDTLLIDGFMDFRLKDFIQIWKNKVDENINKCFVRSEYDEFIDLLRAYVELRPSRIELVHIIQKNRGYMILDDAGRAISAGQQNEEDGARTPEDEMFSILLAIIPNKIIFHKSKNTNLLFLRLIQSVFEGKVHVIE